jgi:pyruvate formate lyase activating enzyme
MNKLEIRGIKGIEETLIDYPGHPAVILYCQGCNFKCGFCHNVGLVNGPEEPDIIWARLREELIGRINLVEALVVSGGEPTLNQGLTDLLGFAKELELLTKLDTNGTDPQQLDRLLGEGFLDLVALDVKQRLNAKKYAAAAGVAVDLDVVKESIAILRRDKATHIFRTTVVPRLHTREDVIAIARELAGAKKYILQPFVPREDHVDPEYAGQHSFSIEELTEWAEQCSDYLPTEVRGSKK